MIVEKLRSLVNQGLVERQDFDGATSLEEAADNVLRRLRGDEEVLALPEPTDSGADIEIERRRIQFRHSLL
jgi:hypothetical protein